MRSTLVLVEFALLLVGLTILADRVLARRAERVAAGYLAEPFGRPPVVRVHGPRFLGQVLSGRFADIEVSCDDVRIGGFGGATLRARLHDVVFSRRDLLARRVTSLRCRQLSGVILLPYPEVARVSRVPGLTLGRADGRLIAALSVPLPGVRQLARASGEAHLSASDGVVWLRVRGFSVAGITLPSRTLQQLVPSLSVPFPLPELPYGLRVDGLRPVDAGLLVLASAENVVFVPPG